MINLPPIVLSLVLVAILLPMFACSSTPTVDPQTLPAVQMLKVWPDGAPGEPVWEGKGDVPKTRYNDRGRLEFVHEPTLEVFHAKGDNRTGAAVVICPGGGYRILADDHEGTDVARWLNDNGITGVVLRYRMFPYRHPVPMMDVQRALQTVRANSDAWAIDDNRIGVLGFSAGGHLASTATVHHIAADPDADDPIKRVTSRPDFSVLVCPVITMRPPHAHMGSRKNLLGAKPSDELLDLMSTEKQINKQTPPTLLIHSKDDRAVPIGNSEMFLAALKQHGVAGEMVVYAKGGHGYGLGRGNGHETDAWPAQCIDWLQQIGAVSKPARSDNNGQ